MAGKLGLDDWFAAGHRPSELLGLVKDDVVSDPLANSWMPIDPWSVLGGEQVDEGPTLFCRTDDVGLVYPARVHNLIGEPESCKGWAALLACTQVLSSGGHVLYVDFETEPTSIFARLRSLGVADEVLAERFHYVRPEEPLTDDAWGDLEQALTPAPRLVILDGVTEAMQLHGLKVEDNTDAAKFIHLLPKRLTRLGCAVVMIDHVTKARQGRGRWAIGAQHKLAAVDASYMFVVVEPFGRGCEGRVSIYVNKDRPGYVRAHADNSLVGELVLKSSADGGDVTLVLAPPDGSKPWRPTVLMERLSRHIETYPGSSVNDIRKGVSGDNNGKSKALQLLIDEGYVRVDQEGQAHRHYSIRAFRNDDDGDFGLDLDSPIEPKGGWDEYHRIRAETEW